MKSEWMFEADGIVKTFGPTKALAGVHFQLRRGEVHGLMGENGSGKSTLSSIIAGIQRCDQGEMRLEGQPYSPKSTLEAVDNGVCMIVQEQGTFTGTTVAENIFIGKEKEFYRGGLLSVKKMQRSAQEILNSLGMEHISAARLCGSLSFEDRKLIEIARAMYAKPKILIIDETTSALSKRGRDILYALMERLKGEGGAVIFISHDIDELMEKCDALTVLRDGHYIDRLEKDAFEQGLIKQLMVGREMLGAYYREDYESSHGPEVALTAEHLTRGIVQDVSFQAFRGEILGIGGLNECGMHELGRLLFGLDARERGTTAFEDGQTYENATAAMKLGIGYISKNRDKEAILTAGSIRDNICLPSLKKLERHGLISNKREKNFVKKYTDALNVKMSDMNQYCMYLSGGNKQKVAIAKWIGFDASVLIMDCPTRGIDIGVKAEIYRLMEQMKAQGKTIILISEELAELIGMSDRILIMKNGRISREFLRSRELTDRDMIHYMI